jgi:serine O-acetyltransferase
MKQSFSETIKLIKSDFIKRCEYEHKTYRFRQSLKFLFYPACLSVVIYRLQRFFFTNHLALFASILKAVNEVLLSVSIHSDTVIGERFMIMHSSFVNIGPRVKIGTDFIAVHHNGIMPSPFFSGDSTSLPNGPTIGNHVILGGGAMITGDIVIGDHVKISMNASVEDSFESYAVLFGVPARNVAKKTAE